MVGFGQGYSYLAGITFISIPDGCLYLGVCSAVGCILSSLGQEHCGEVLLILRLLLLQGCFPSVLMLPLFWAASFLFCVGLMTKILRVESVRPTRPASSLSLPLLADVAESL